MLGQKGNATDTGPAQEEALRKHPYSNILKISPPKTESFSDKISVQK